MDQTSNKILNDLIDQRTVRQLQSKGRVLRTSSTDKPFITNMDFASLYPSSMRIHFPSRLRTRVIKIKKILSKINDKEG